MTLIYRSSGAIRSSDVRGTVEGSHVLMSSPSVSRSERVGVVFCTDPVDGAGEVAVGYCRVARFNSPQWLAVKR